MKKHILIIFILSLLLQGCNSLTTDFEIEKAQKEFTESFCKAYVANDMTEILKLTHPKCVTLFKEKGAYLTLIQMLRPSPKEELSYFYTCSIEKKTSEPNKAKSEFEAKTESMTIFPTERTHVMKVHFMLGDTHIYFYRDLIYEDGKFFLTLPYQTPECIKYQNELFNNLQKKIDSMPKKIELKSK